MFFEKGHEAAARDRANGYTTQIKRHEIDFGEAIDELDALGITDEDARSVAIERWLDGYMVGQRTD